jgi:hypothetical protein
LRHRILNRFFQERGAREERANDVPMQKR